MSHFGKKSGPKNTQNVAFKISNFDILNDFCLFKTDLSGNTI